MAKVCLYRIITIFLLTFFTITSQNAMSATIAGDLLFINQPSPETCNEGLVTGQFLLGTFGGIMCDDENNPQICELFFTPDPGQDHDYKPLYKGYEPGSEEQYRINPYLSSFKADNGTRVKILVEREHSYTDFGNGTSECSGTDKVTSINTTSTPPKQANKTNTEFLGENIDVLLANASKARENKIGIPIKKVQLGMNEYNFLQNIKVTFPVIMKNHAIWYTSGLFNKERDANLSLYILATNEQADAINSVGALKEIVMLELFAKEQFTVAIFVDGLLDTFRFAGLNFEELFKKSNVPSMDFLEAFADGYDLDFELSGRKNNNITYTHKAANSTWEIYAKVDRAEDSVIAIYMEILEEEQKPEFD
jgi:hypothetical protein